MITERDMTNGLTRRAAHQGPDDQQQPRPAVEVPAKAVRRRFTAAYKASILDQADKCAPGELGALLRREGLYSSHLTKWRRQRAAGRLEPNRPSTKAERDAALRRVAELERDNRRLRQGLQRAETIITVQKKLCALFNLPTADGDGKS